MLATCLLLAATLARPPSAGSAAAAEDPPKSPAAQMLDEAEAAAARGSYAKAVALYKKLATDFPQDEEGRIGERRAQDNGFLGWTWLLENGPSSNRVDVVVMGEGFRLDQQGDYDTLAKMVTREFPRVEVFEEYFSYFNFVRVNLRSKDDGVDGNKRDYSTALNAASSGGIQSQVTVDRRAVNAMLNEIPQFDDGITIVLVKNGVLGTGGNGIATVGGREPKTMVHEFGHAFGGLMDEYSANTGHRGQVSAGPNVSKVEDPKQVPWAHWLEARVSGIGVYEGADGRPQGAFKPTNNCIMDVGQEFCPVCREALIQQMYLHVDPIESTTPPAHISKEDALVLSARTPLRDQVPLVLSVETMKPKTHSLFARWYVLKDEDAPPTFTPRREANGRENRGALPKIPAKPLKDTKAIGGRDSFTFKQEDYAPGLWRIVLRVEDTTRVPKDRKPWVLKDDLDLLKSERCWWVKIDP